eukprot:PLAT15953.1.p3 GENE.PLAT15953.1~~PLAT15953.1.p3  ORF type:complete len:137 (+),score=48.97 PLAT15953.1:56-466(+)
MVIRTETCSFSEWRIYPGHGMRFVRRDGQPHVFLNAKSKRLFLQRKKPARLTWTTAWRRLNRKDKSTREGRRRVRRKRKVQRAIVGVSLEELVRRKEERPEQRAAARERALREVRERRRNAKKGGDKKRRIRARKA